MSGDSDGDLKATPMPEEAMGGKQPRTACTMPWMMMGSKDCHPQNLICRHANRREQGAQATHRQAVFCLYGCKLGNLCCS